MNWPYQLPPPKETIGIAAAVIGLLIFVAFLETKYRDARTTSFGFGAGWHCLDVPQGEPVCLKDQRAK